MINQLVYLINFLTFVTGVKVARRRTDLIKRTVEHTDNLSRFITDNGVLLFVPQNVALSLGRCNRA
jgi:hypothetical protein